MKNFPYYFIAFSTMMVSMLTGIALDSGADYIKDQAQLTAKVRLLNAMDIRTLTQINVADL